MYFPFDLFISGIQYNKFPTEISLKEHIEKNYTFGSVINLRVFSYTYVCNAGTHMEIRGDHNSINIDSVIRQHSSCNHQGFYTAIATINWDVENMSTWPILTILRTSHFVSGGNTFSLSPYNNDKGKEIKLWFHEERYIKKPLELVKYLYDNSEKEKQTESEIVELKCHIENLLYDKSEKEKQTESKIVELKGHIENILYDQTQRVERMNHLESQIENLVEKEKNREQQLSQMESQIENLVEKESESQKQIENLLYDKLTMASRLHILESQIQQILEKEKEKEKETEPEKSLLSYVFGKTK